ncbi:MAG: response regulator, partial [Opitutae bacterium]|nr:response regulator [Opitutae bacterium]
MKVLIAEDDPNTREGLRDILETEGYEVLTVPDGQKALETYRVEKPQVLCLDIMMPQVNGYDVCREIRRTDSRTPILFISAKSEEIDKVLGLEIGADDFIVKPFGVK